MYSNEQLAAMIAALAKRVKKLEGQDSNAFPTIDYFLSELLKESKRLY